ncbi:MAG: hypothetical protein IJ091_04085 [Oscillospiraceae bacterium]|nr:hypothetical protein [Oscillospiraceae bacterium]
MYQVNDVVSYSSAGVCDITDITRRSIAGTSMDYYVLKPQMDQKSTVFVPINNQKLISRMRTPLNSSQAEALLASLCSLGTNWIDNDNERKEVYLNRITEGCPDELAQIYKTLTLRRKELEENSRKLRSADENFLKQCEKLLSYEIGLATGHSLEDIKSKIFELCNQI